MKIEALIFDLGGVVFDYSFDRAFEAWSAVMDRSAGDIKGLFRFSDSFEKFERNDITPRQFVDSVSHQLGYQFDDASFEKGWNGIYLDPISHMGDLLADLKKNYRLVALTNTNKVHAKVWVEKYSNILKHFEKVFSSHQIGARKPEAKAFQIVLEYLDLSPRQTIFLDDKLEYTDGAKQMGINTILFTSYDQMISDLGRFSIQL